MRRIGYLCIYTHTGCLCWRISIGHNPSYPPRSITFHYHLTHTIQYSDSIRREKANDRHTVSNRSIICLELLRKEFYKGLAKRTSELQFDNPEFKSRRFGWIFSVRCRREERNLWIRTFPIWLICFSRHNQLVVQHTELLLRDV